MKKMLFLILLSLFFISCDKELSVEVEKEIPVENYSLKVNSDPIGIKVFIDGKNTGKITPATIGWLSNSFHDVKLVSDYFEPVVYNININSGDSTVFHNFKKYEKNYGALYINSNPLGANIYFNNKFGVDQTPAKYEKVLGGKYKIKCTLEGHRDDSIEVAIKGQSINVVTLKLRDTTLFVDYSNIENFKNIYKINSVAYYKNELWVSSEEYGILVVGPNEIRNFTLENSILPTYKITNMKVIDSDLWICTSLGILKITGDSWELYNNQNAPFEDNYTTSIVKDKKGNYWIGTTSGLLKYNNGIWKLYNNTNSELLNSVIFDLSVDKKDRIWFSTAIYGFGYYENEKVKYFKPSDYSLFGENSLSIYVDSKNRVWVNMLANSKKGYPGGLHILDADNENIIFSYPKLATTYDFIEILNKDMWLATKDGIYKFDENLTLSSHYKANSQTGFKNSKVVSMATDNFGNIWLGTELGGLTKFKVWKLNN